MDCFVPFFASINKRAGGYYSKKKTKLTSYYIFTSIAIHATPIIKVTTI